ncbi:Uncharacterized conserved protein [Plasmopara halstedii]|uniref:Uncharacterized conserved protein n=1 Tax=Plasmopara halstedii TaxID=4781 RepID=A0A0P1A954_PLAHL|nr:Uncharacterized conserved protein [Plasmopara halstedii]CEG36765.1 Uncharacterized conserved protein [Plasmopara halstedii]|eukprot:XP_024573134.1 Uncharacterized conserved protein [Plasmopara halstedii]
MELDPLDAYMASLELPCGSQLLHITQARSDYSAKRSLTPKSINVVVKNRRYRRLQQLVKDTSDDDSFFSDRMMQMRSPALFHFHLGQYLGLKRESTLFSNNEGQKLSSFLLETCQRHEMEIRRLKEQKTWTTFVAVDKKYEKRRLEKLYEERRQQLIEIMKHRFLSGMDSEYVNYAEIDANEELDDLDEMQRDAEDRYFAE